MFDCVRIAKEETTQAMKCTLIDCVRIAKEETTQAIKSTLIDCKNCKGGNYAGNEMHFPIAQGKEVKQGLCSNIFRSANACITCPTQPGKGEKTMEKER